MIRLEILGTVDLRTADGVSADAFLKQPKAVGLLAFLALARPKGFVRRDELLGMLWPDLDQTSARRALSSQLYRVRQQLGPEAIESRGSDEVALGEDVWCDAAEFLRLLGSGAKEQALELYRGPLLPGFYLPTADTFERWLDEQRSVLVRRAREAAWEVTDEARAAGDLTRAIRWARQALAISPHDEPGFRRLLSLFAAAGNRAGALQAYDAFARQLRREYDIEPDAETQALIRQIAHAQPAIPQQGPQTPEARHGDRAGPSESGAQAHRPFSLSPVSATSGAAGEADDRSPAMSLPELKPAHSIADEYLGTTTKIPAPLPRRTKVLWITVAAVVALAGVLSSFLLKKEPPVAENAALPRLAILYLDADPTNQALRDRADALTESLISRMSGSEHFDVLSSSAVQAFRAADTLPKGLAPTYVVHGSMREDRNRVRVHIELMDAAAGINRFSAQIDRDTAAIFELTDELVREISEMLRLELGKEVRLARWYRTASNPAAARMLHRAEISRIGATRVRNLNDRGAERRLLLESDSLAMEASKLDPTWPEPDVLRSTNAVDLFFNAFARNDAERKTEALVRGIEAATTALRKEPDFAPALEKRGLLLGYGWEDRSLPSGMQKNALIEAEADLRRAIDLDPRRPLAWAYISRVLMDQNKLEEAHWAAERAYKMDAFQEGWPAILSMLFTTSFELRKFDDAETWCREWERRFVEDWAPGYCRLLLEAYTPQKPRSINEAWQLARLATSKVDEARQPGIQVLLEPLVAAIIARHQLPDSAAHVLDSVYRRKAANTESLRLIAATWNAMGDTRNAQRILAEYMGEHRNATHVSSSWLFQGLNVPVPDPSIKRR